jgi:branched-chain amino acid transport system ATP-binding protein
MLDPVLEVNGLSVRRHGRGFVLRNIEFAVKNKSTLAVLGANGAGKSSLLDTLSGFLKPESGTIRLLGESIEGKAPHVIARRGLVQVSQSRDLFTNLSVSDNLTLGAFVRGASREKDNLVRVFDYFPKLAERRKQIAGTLSGGEQQMVAIGRALMTEPEILLLDEPASGLSPLIVHEIGEMLERLRKTGLAMILVEQNMTLAAAVADSFLLLRSGDIVARGDASELTGKADGFLKAHYV